MKNVKLYHRTEKKQCNIFLKKWEVVPCDDWVVEVNGLIGYFKTESEAKKALNEQLEQCFKI